MSSEKVHTDLFLSKKVVDEIDALVGEEGRSKFIDEALEEQLRRMRLLATIEAVNATPPQPGAPPEWDTPEGAAKWVHDLRYTKSTREKRIEAMRREDTVGGEIEAPVDEPLDDNARRERLLRIMDRVDATPPPPGDPPEWDTPEGVARWVHDLRREESSQTRRVEELQREEHLIANEL